MLRNLSFVILALCASPALADVVEWGLTCGGYVPTNPAQPHGPGTHHHVTGGITTPEHGHSPFYSLTYEEFPGGRYLYQSNFALHDYQNGEHHFYYAQFDMTVQASADGAECDFENKCTGHFRFATVEGQKFEMDAQCWKYNGSL